MAFWVTRQCRLIIWWQRFRRISCPHPHVSQSTWFVPWTFRQCFPRKHLKPAVILHCVKTRKFAIRKQEASSLNKLDWFLLPKYNNIFIRRLCWKCDKILQYYEVCKAKKRRTEQNMRASRKTREVLAVQEPSYMETVRDVIATKLLVNFEKWKYKFQETWSNVL